MNNIIVYTDGSYLNNQNSKNNQSVIYVGPSITPKFNKKNKNKNKFYHVKTIKFFSLFYFIAIFNKLFKFKPDIIVLHNFQILIPLGSNTDLMPHQQS